MVDGSSLRIFAAVSAVIVMLCHEPVNSLTKPSGVKLRNNGYTGIVVAIHPEEPENPELIEIIKRVFVNGSAFLHTATRKRAYFKEVTILVPLTWSSHPSYGSPGNATLDGADVLIAPRNPKYALQEDGPAAPYTKQFEGCGKTGLHIHMTSSFLLNHAQLQPLYGDYGRVLVHEWGHYRWGLFNEYPDPIADPDNVEHFYYSAGSRTFEPTTCSTGWRMRYIKYYEESGKGAFRLCQPRDPFVGFEEGCIPLPADEQPAVTGSIMYGQLKFEHVTQFCDSDADDESYTHNVEAVNKHNRLCTGRSCWEVMREHQDFKGNNNPPRDIADTTPTFRVVRAFQTRTVLVLDTSGSMQFHSRLTRLESAVRDFITSFAADGSFLALVEFSSGARIITDLQEITSDSIRQSLASQIPESASGGTCIGCGLDAALEVFTRHGSGPQGGKILLITDGEDFEPLLTEEMQEECLLQGVIIDSIAFSEEAEANVGRLSTVTGGKFYLQTDSSQSTGLQDALSELAQGGGMRDFDRRITLYSRVFSFKPEQNQLSGSLYIDPTIGRETTFSFTYYVESSPPGGPSVMIGLTSPSGARFFPGSEGYNIDSVAKRINIDIEDIAESGSWDFVLMNQNTDTNHDVFVSVASFPSSEDVEPIIVSSTLSGTEADVLAQKPLIAFAEVRQGLFPIIGVTVTAIIERPPDVYGTPSEPVELQLWDNGSGADVTKEDGIYSRYFTEFTGVGFYGIKLRVENSGNATILKYSKHSDINPQFLTFSRYSVDELLNGSISDLGGEPFFMPGMPLPDHSGERAPNFTRQASGGATRVSSTPRGWSPTVDSLPPNKVIDLLVQVSSFEKHPSVTLSFTAPGDDLDNGRATRYIFYRADTVGALRSPSEALEIAKEDIICGDVEAPSSFGTRETFVIRVPMIQADAAYVSYVFAVLAEDDVGNRGELSNMARIAIGGGDLRRQDGTQNRQDVDSICRGVARDEDEQQTTLWADPFSDGDLETTTFLWPTSEIPDVEELVCPSSWHKHGDMCYRFFDVSVPWKEANRMCTENLGGNLTEIRTQETNAFVSLLTRSGNNQRLKPAWIGLKYDKSSNQFLWRKRNSPGSGAGFWPQSSSAIYRPGKRINAKFCIAINYNGEKLGSWKRLSCNKKQMGFICEKRLF